jgi:hypothetical protein
VTLDYHGYVLECHAGVPDVVWVDEDYGPLVVTPGAGVTQHHKWREPTPLDLCAELLEEFVPALCAAAALAWRGAHKDLPQLRHCHILRHAGGRGVH